MKIKLVPAHRVLIDLVAIWEADGASEGSPAHVHEIPGVWNNSGGMRCAKCATYDEARRIVADLKSRGES